MLGHLFPYKQGSQKPRDTTQDPICIQPIDQCQDCQQNGKPKQDYLENPENGDCNGGCNENLDPEPDPNIECNEDLDKDCSHFQSEEFDPDCEHNPASGYNNSPDNEDLISEHPTDDTTTDLSHSDPQCTVEEDKSDDQSDLIIDVGPVPKGPACFESIMSKTVISGLNTNQDNSQTNKRSSFITDLSSIAEELEPTSLQSIATTAAPMDPDPLSDFDNQRNTKFNDRSDLAVDSGPATQETVPCQPIPIHYRPVTTTYPPVPISYHPAPYPYQHIPIPYTHFQHPYCQPVAQPQSSNPSHSPPAPIEYRYPPISFPYYYPPSSFYHQYHPPPHPQSSQNSNSNPDQETPSFECNNHRQQDYEHHCEDNHINYF
ncbi:hypothetical protein MJO28_014714 [Puccinia striiformis f. sp. tritici]|uniref:Uncharacterized protein n=1 Tax=Puccinia striiformis f. sp. tritici TaxID=168172 RepID=A0ACC0DWD8_9BASI|nr:hypothetical protein MJO28_014714 [Puccinia striiformis f. sp. tritici]